MKRQKGVAAVEMAIILPVVLLIFLGLAQFGWLLMNTVAVTNAASAGARFFASQRGSATPYTSTQTQVQAAGSLLTSSDLTISTSVNGVACSDDTNCAAELASASSPSVNIPATVNISYSGFQSFFKGSYLGLNSMMPSTLTSSVTERVQ
jgi:Flp pilus assembly protein TadG